MKYNFDKVIDRKNTNSLKWDCAARRGMPNDLLPMWVADMDFCTPPEITRVLSERAAHGVFGYSEPADNYFDILSKWLARRFDWDIEREWLHNTPGIVFAVASAIRAFTAEGDAILIQPPVYYPFKNMIAANGRKLITNPLRLDEATLRYEIDFLDFEQKIKDNNVKMFILCSPHNPVGRVWTESELLRLGEICERYNVVVLSDEIHADFVYGDGCKHIPFTRASKRFQKNSVICFSPGKTFNLAGLQYSDIFIADPKLREAFGREYAKSGYSQLNVFGIAGAAAAYTHGEPWLTELLAYLKGNAEFIDTYLKKHAPQIKMIKPQGTFLAWLDCRALGLAPTELDKLMTDKAKLWLDGGTIFGTEGAGFERLNFGCPRAVVEAALANIAKAIK